MTTLKTIISEYTLTDKDFLDESDRLETALDESAENLIPIYIQDLIDWYKINFSDIDENDEKEEIANFAHLAKIERQNYSRVSPYGTGVLGILAALCWKHERYQLQELANEHRAALARIRSKAASN